MFVWLPDRESCGLLSQPHGLIAAIAVGTTAGAQRINHFFYVERTCLQQTDLFGFYIARFANAIPVDSSHICYSGGQSCAIGAIPENDSSFVITAF